MSLLKSKMRDSGISWPVIVKNKVGAKTKNAHTHSMVETDEGMALILQKAVYINS